MYFLPSRINKPLLGCNSLFFGSLMEKKCSLNGATYSTYEQFFFEIQWMMRVEVAWTAEMAQALTVRSIPSTYRQVWKVYHGPSTFLHNDIDGTLMRYQSNLLKREPLNWFKKLQLSQFILKDPSKVLGGRLMGLCVWLLSSSVSFLPSLWFPISFHRSILDVIGTYSTPLYKCHN